MNRGVDQNEFRFGNQLNREKLHTDHLIGRGFEGSPEDLQEKRPSWEVL